MKVRAQLFLTLIFSWLLVACDDGSNAASTGGGGAAPPSGVDAGVRAWFVDEGTGSGIDFAHESGHDDERFYMPESMCGGVALFDMDDDGDLDAYLVQSGRITQPPSERPPNRLYRNRGDGTFEDATDGSGTGDRGYGVGVATGDYDRDGDLDVYVTNVGPDVLLRNDGDGRFHDVTADAGLGDDGYASSAAFVDYDHDGDLDLIVLRYLIWSPDSEIDCDNDLGQPDYCQPSTYNAPAIDLLYRNEGDGTFTDVTEAAGLAAAFGTGLGVVCGDFTGDGLVDLFVANDGYEDQLWVNQGDGTFVDRAMAMGCAIDLEGKAKAGMGVTAADIDDDGDLDVMVCNLARESDSLFTNEGGYFNDSTARLGLGTVSRRFTRFGMAWLDFDNDGVLDLYQANGRVARQNRTFGDDQYAEPNLLFRGTGAGRFEEVSPRGGTAMPHVGASRGAAFGDIDGDGGLDVVVANRDGSPHVLRNVVHDRGHWIAFRVLDEHGSDALGATVTLQAGERRVVRDVRTAFSYCSANDARVHVGLGETAEVTDVTVRWVDGTEQSFGTIAADQVVDLHR